jgi:N-acetylmuramoyl-L-alanine amidase
VDPAVVERVRYTAEGGSTRVIVMLSRAVPYEVRILPGESTRGSERRLVLDFSNAKLGGGAAQPIGVEDGLLKQIRAGQFTARTARVVLDLASVTRHSVSALDNPPRVIVDIAGHAPAPATEGEKGESLGADAGSAGTRPAADARGAAGARAGAADDRAGGAAGGGVGAPRSTPATDDAPSDRVAPRRPSGREAPAFAKRPGQTPAERRSAFSEDRNREPAAALAANEPRRLQPESAPPALPEPTPASRVAPQTAVIAPVPPPPPAPPADSELTASPPPVRGTPWRIVLDPGHGGTDPGTQGVDGVYEKDVTLAIAKRLERRLEDGLHAQVLLTRDRDVSRSLAQRTAFANVNSADLFVSIHANADVAGELHGVETYTLNNTDERATIRLAKMENGPGVATGHGDLSFILSDMVQSGKEEDSIALAQHLHSSVVARLRSRYPDVRNLGIKKGPFYVLVGAYMPCVLVETSFLSHPIEGRRLASSAYQDDIAEGLYHGMAEFLGNMRLAKTL